MLQMAICFSVTILIFLFVADKLVFKQLNLILLLIQLFRQSPGGSNTFATWFYSNNLKHVEPTDPDSLTSWLTDSVGAFLSFEIFPGFSIDKIFVLVLTVGILLWFITLLI